MNRRSEPHLSAARSLQHLLALCSMLCLLAMPASQTHAATRTTTLVSVNATGGQGNSFADDAELAGSGRVVAFETPAPLVNDDTNAVSDIYVRDVDSRETTRVSVSSSGTQANTSSSHPTISADGRFVAFNSSASTLVANDTNNRTDIFLRDTQLRQTTRLSLSSSGLQANNTSFSPSISADGRYVAFQSYATNLVSNDTNFVMDVFVRDTQTNQTTRVSVSSSSIQGNANSLAAFISADGRYVAFQSQASNLVDNDTNGVADVFVRDLQTNQTTRVSVRTGGLQTDGTSYNPAEVLDISGDGRYVVFQSQATNLVDGDTNGVADVFLHDRQSAQTKRVSVATFGEQANGASFSPTISTDGTTVGFLSDADNLVDYDTNGAPDAFVRDLRTPLTTRVSISTTGEQANGGTSSYGPDLSDTGTYVVFQSEANNLVADDVNNAQDVFLHEREESGVTVLATITVTPLARDTPVAFKGDTVLRVEVRQLDQPVAGASIFRGGDGPDLYLGETNAKGFLFTTYDRSVTPVPGSFGAIFTAQLPNGQQVNTRFGYSVFRSMLDVERRLDQKSARQLQAGITYKSLIPDTPSSEMEFGLLSKVGSAVEALAFVMKVVKPNEPYEPRADDVINVAIYVYTPEDSAKPTLYRYYEEVKRGGQIIYTGTLYCTTPDEYPLLERGIAMVTVSLASPANLYLVDAQSRRTGTDPVTGQVLTEIPYSYYTGPDAEPEVILLYGPESGDYHLQSVGTGSGPIHVTLGQTSADGTTVFQTSIAMIAPGEVVSQAFGYRLSDVAPDVAVSGPYTIAEGSSLAVDALGTDQSGALVPVSWDLDGDGLFEVEGASVVFSAAGLDGPSRHPITAQAVSPAGLRTLVPTTVDITNTPPSVSEPHLSITRPVPGQPFRVETAFADPSPADAPFTCTVDYGDGSDVQPGTVSDTTCIGPDHVYQVGGSYDVRVQVIDKDGGQGGATRALSVVYPFAGFFQPIDNPPVLNSVKAGSVVPVKFSLGGEWGLAVLSAGSPSSTRVVCDTSLPVDAMEETSAATTNTLHYDTASGQYLYTWKTDKTWRGTCRQFTLRLTDGTTHVATFSFSR